MSTGRLASASNSIVNLEYNPDAYPSVKNAVSDEFDDGVLNAAWGWTTTPTGTVSESQFSGYLLIDAHTSGTMRYLHRAYAPGATAFSVVTKIVPSINDANVTFEVGVSLLDSSNANIVSTLVLADGTSTGAKARRFHIT